MIIALGPFTVTQARADDEPNEYELKAVMLFNLARFVEWPQSAFATSNAPIVIGVIGRNPFGDALEKAVKGETVSGRKITVEHYDSVKELQRCHILFVCSSERPRVSAILAKLKGAPTLSVSEIDGFSRMRGGMVLFYTNNQKRIRLRLNLESARAEGLIISSKLIQVAELDKTTLLWPREPMLGASSLFAAASMTVPNPAAHP